MARPLIVGTGLVALDLVFRGGSKTPVAQRAGGTCGNVLSILSFMSWRAMPVARLAPDRAGAIVRADMERWGVDLRFVGLAPQVATPIVVERIRINRRGEVVHGFSWTCPCCGAWLPRYRPVPSKVAEVMAETDAAGVPAVFFFDRPSRAAIALATMYDGKGALIVFEPSANAEPALFERATELAHVVKYSEQRLAAIPRGARPDRLEVQTRGAQGLRFRRGDGKWKHLPALSAGAVVDTAGAGDWCTAGLLSRLGSRTALGDAADGRVADALRFGQALAAWNCRFEGARGGMYTRSKEEFGRDIAELLDGSIEPAVTEIASTSETLTGICPSCPALTRRAVRKARGA